MADANYQIYEITNIVDNKIYIGKTRRSAYKRLEEHILGHCEDLKNDINIHGLDNFKIKILRDNLDRNDAKIMERFYIENASKKGKNLYNIYCAGKRRGHTPAVKQVSFRQLFGFTLNRIKKQDSTYLCRDDFKVITKKLKKKNDKYIALELDDYDVIFVRKAN